MVRAWIMDDNDGDQREPHMTNPPQFMELNTLKEKTGLEYFKIDVDNLSDCKLLKEVRQNRGYTYEDSVKINEDFPNYKKQLGIFFEEHMHADEEVRLVVEGSGYFDIRNHEDQWVRIELIKGDMIVLPAGMYHRFTLDVKNYIKANRYFVGKPVWTPHNRPCEEHPSRQQYVAAQKA